MSLTLLAIATCLSCTASYATTRVAISGSTTKSGVYNYDVSAKHASAHAEREAHGTRPMVPTGLASVLPPLTRTPVFAAEGDSGLVNLASDGRTTHILDGDATGGGHAWPGLPGKTPFPESWSRDQIMHEISDVATDPNSTFSPGRGGSTIVTGTRDGVDIQVIIRDGEIITGYPTNLPRNP